MITGSRVLPTDVGGVMRGWLVFSVEGFRMPSVLTLPDQPYGGEVDPQEAHIRLNESGTELHQRLVALDEEQLFALAQQTEEDDHTGAELVERLLRYWDRPRLEGVDWMRVYTTQQLTTVRNRFQEHDYVLAVGDAVMLAGDGFADVHGTVEEVGEDAWVVRVHWREWDR